MSRTIARLGLTGVLVALGLLVSASTASADNSNTVNATQTNQGLHIDITNTGSSSDSNALIRLNNGTAIGCSPSADCTAGGQFTQFDFIPPLAPGSTFSGDIFTSPAPYSGTFDVKIFVNGGGEVDMNSVPVGAAGPSGPPSAGALVLPAKVKVDPKTGKGTFDARWGPLNSDNTLSGTEFFARTAELRRAICEVDVGPKCGSFLPHTKLTEVGTISDTHIVAGESEVPLTVQVQDWVRRVTRSRGSRSKGLVRGVYAFFNHHDVEVQGTLSNPWGSTPFQEEMKLVFERTK